MSIQILPKPPSFLDSSVPKPSEAKMSYRLIHLMGKLFRLIHKQTAAISTERNHTKELQNRVTQEETWSYRLQAASFLLKIPAALQIGPAYQIGFQIASDSSNTLFQSSLNAKRSSKENAQLTLSELAQNSSALSAAVDKLMDALRQIQQHEGAR